MTPTRLRAWMRKYGNWGVLMVAAWFGLRWLRTRRLPSALAVSVILALSLFLYGAAFHFRKPAAVPVRPAAPLALSSIAAQPTKKPASIWDYAMPVYLPDGKRILFKILDRPGWKDGFYTVRVDGTDLRRVPFLQSCDFIQRISKDGSRWLYLHGENEALYSIHSDGSHRRRLLPDKVSCAAFTFDEKNIVYCRYEGGEPYGGRIMLMRRDGRFIRSYGHPAPLATDEIGPWNAFSIAACPDGKSILFSGSEDGVKRLFQMSLEDGDTQELKDASGNSDGDNPVISPDGKTIYYAAGAEWVSTLESAHINGSHRRRLTQTAIKEEPGEYWPSLSPDGKRLAVTIRNGPRFAVTPGSDDIVEGHFAIYTMNTDGSDMRPLLKP